VTNGRDRRSIIGYRKPIYSRQREANGITLRSTETVIQLDDQRYWLYAAVDPETNEFLHVKLYPTRTTALTEMFLSELREKHDIQDAVFLVDSAP